MKTQISDRALYSKDGNAWSNGKSLRWEADESVTKIVLGDHGNREEKIALRAALPENLRELYPRLTHLHVWNVQLGESLPLLPSGLEVLDLRHASGLTAIAALPSGLKTLVLEDCLDLVDLQIGGGDDLAELEDLSLAGSAKLDCATISYLAQSAPNVRRLDLSKLPALDSWVNDWPEQLERIDLNACENLVELPELWPKRLRRLGLRGAKALRSLDGLQALAGIDYLDLRGCASLREFPRFKSGAYPRTLYLHGSGITAPPAAEHGEEDENVAEKTEKFFDEIAAFGSGEAKACKLLLLGNGYAGKTHFAQLLTTGASARPRGSTHGVQFWPWKLAIKNERGEKRSVAMQIWDFGGQEIYHGTHRLFASAGSVFVVLWNPDEEAEAQKREPPSSYEDEKRPLVYWLDYIHEICKQPEVAIVCSRRVLANADTKRRLFESLTDKYSDLSDIYFVDSEPNDGRSFGQKRNIESWLASAVGRVVTAEQASVPSFWEIAQELVAASLRAKDDRSPRVMIEKPVASKAEFAECLTRAIRQTVKAEGAKYGKLKAAVDGGTFDLKEGDRLERLLGFLSRSGWVYWNERLFDSQVIVDQKWALDGIYAVLDRDPKVYGAILQGRGRFTLKDLNDLCWKTAGKARYSEDEQFTILSFMEQCDLIFREHSSEESWRGETVYVSFEHLRPGGIGPESVRSNEDDSAVVQATLSSERLHKGQWQRLLVEFGRQYGSDADYYSDGLQLYNRDGQRVRIWREIRSTGIGGKIGVSVSPLHAPLKPSGELVYGRPLSVRERFEQLVEFVARFVEDIDRPVEDKAEVREGWGFSSMKLTTVSPKTAGDAMTAIDVFVSYTWNPKRNAAGNFEIEVPIDYEEPVNLIEERFREWSIVDENARVRLTLLRDSTSLGLGGSIRAFMQNGCKSSKVIIVHSDKYFYSTCCMFELHCIREELSDKVGKSWRTVVIPVALGTGHLDDGLADRFTRFWRGAPMAVRSLRDKDLSTLPRPPLCDRDPEAFWKGVLRGFRHINEHTNVETMSENFCSAIDRFSDRIVDFPGWNIPWNHDNPDTTLQRIKARILGEADSAH